MSPAARADPPSPPPPPRAAARFLACSNDDRHAYPRIERLSDCRQNWQRRLGTDGLQTPRRREMDSTFGTAVPKVRISEACRASRVAPAPARVMRQSSADPD